MERVTMVEQKIRVAASIIRVFFMRDKSLNLDTFYPIPIQLQGIGQIVSLFSLIFDFSDFSLC